MGEVTSSSDSDEVAPCLCFGRLNSISWTPLRYRMKGVWLKGPYYLKEGYAAYLSSGTKNTKPTSTALLISKSTILTGALNKGLKHVF
ncbi:hypothetical protein M569_00127 [Genlisea aurea]|uniref:Uncharacterized protein n=1 Tax=Genlisea aurea TaxID=192259 RepID=S8EF57_9LAMI|nr:hypothetical protein M569_00127 [Genlisea aurea]